VKGNSYMDEQRNPREGQFEIERDGESARLAYEVDNTALQLLVCELLLKNQELRVQLTTQRDSAEELHSR
jgi:hypothetical protein